MYPAMLGTRGRVVLPPEVRRALGAAEGETLFFIIGPDGVRLVRSPEDYSGWMGFYGSGPASGPDPDDLDLPGGHAGEE